MNQRDAMENLGIEIFRNPPEYSEALRILNLAIGNVQRASDRIMGRKPSGQNVRRNTARKKASASADSGIPEQS